MNHRTNGLVFTYLFLSTFHASCSVMNMILNNSECCKFVIFLFEKTRLHLTGKTISIYIKDQTLISTYMSSCTYQTNVYKGLQIQVKGAGSHFFMCCFCPNSPIPNLSTIAPVVLTARMCIMLFHRRLC